MINIPDKDQFSETAVGRTTLFFVKIVNSSSLFEKCLAVFAKAKVWLLFDTVWFALFLKTE